MNRRLQQFLDAENITQAQFATRIHVAPASISHILAGRNKPGFDFIQSTMMAFPELNIEWLISGQGKMYKTSRQAEPDTLFGNDNVFFGTELQPTGNAPGIENPKEEREESRNISSTEREPHPVEHSKIIEKQRNAVKIVVFYDDGTFQEFQ